MAEPYGTYVAILDRDRATAVCGAGLRRLAFDAEAMVRPQCGDRVALLSVRGPLFVSDAAFVGTADAIGHHGAALKLRHRVLAPVEAALPATARAHGPRAKRPAHRRPRTPGRRALIAGRAAVGRRP